MKRAGFAALLVCAAVFAGESVGQGQGRGDGRMRRSRQPIPNQYIVVLNAGEDPGQVGREAAAAHRGRPLHTYRRALNGFAVQLTAEAAARLSEDPRVRFVEEDSVLTASQSQTNPPGGLDRIDQRLLPLDGIYAYGEVAAFVRVHVIDTGIRVTHQEFGGRAAIGGDYVDDDGDGDPSDVANDDADPSSADGVDCNGHGTHVAGTIGGATYGVAKSVTLRSYRILDCAGSGSVSGALAAIEAINNDAYRPAVVNMSLGGEASDALDAAVRGAIANGLTFVVAAGNSLSNASNFSPARVAEAVTVGATDVNDVRAWFSNYGPALDLFAPGVDVASAWFTADDAVMSISGTSMAAPHAAGVAALYLSRDPDMTPEQVHNQLVSAATPNTVISPGSGSPNRVLYSSLDQLSAPVIDMLGPDAGERLLAGRPYTIQWQASDPDGLASFDVLLSTNGGASYAPLAGCAGLDAAQRACTWGSPGPETTTARIRVVVRDLTGDSSFDQSSGNFSIVMMPDMVTVETLHSTARLSPGSSFSASDRVRNAGNASSGTSTTRYYLSLDSEKGFGDMQLSGSRSIPDLAPDAESAGTVTLSISASASPGTYHLLACADVSRQIKELDESNNCKAAPAQIVIEYANLVETAVGNPPASAAPGSSFTATDTVRNASEVTANSSRVRYYLSVDATKDAADVLLTGTRSVPELSANTASTGDRSVGIPSATPTGTYRLLACADDLLLVDEANEADNCIASASQMVVELPDLVTTTVSHQPGAATPGSSIAVTDTVLNASTVTAGSATTRYYLSPDGAKSGDDVQLTGSRYVLSLAGGASSTATRTVYLPDTLAPGAFRIIACADSSLNIDESNESNNCAAAATTLLITVPDLVMASISSPPSSASPGSRFSVTDSVQNASAVATGYTTTRYYLSIDAVKGAGDIMATTIRFVSGLDPGESSTGSRTITVPDATPPGTYRVLACADDTFKVDESNEANNCLASATAVEVALPDLVATSISNPPDSIAAGGSFSVTESVQNVGAAATEGWTKVRYSLSADTTFDAGDLLLTASRSVYVLAPGATSTGSRTLRMPTTPGTYYVIACADAEADVSESDESNNCVVSTSTVGVGGGG